MRKTNRFKDLEFTYQNMLYYISGSVYLRITEKIGGNYEGYDYEIIADREVDGIELDEIYYIDENINDKVDVLGLPEYREVEDEILEYLKFLYS